MASEKSGCANGLGNYPLDAPVHSSYRSGELWEFDRNNVVPTTVAWRAGAPFVVAAEMRQAVLDTAICIKPWVNLLEVLRVPVLVVLPNAPGHKVCGLDESRHLGVHIQGYFDKAVERTQPYSFLPL